MTDKINAEVCKECNKKAVYYNPFNGVIQCNNCGCRYNFNEFLNMKLDVIKKLIDERYKMTKYTKPLSNMPEKNKELSIHNFVEDKIEPKDCNKCIHESVCKMLDYIHKDNFKLGLLLSRFFEIYTDSNLADKCVKYKEEVVFKCLKRTI